MHDAQRMSTKQIVLMDARAIERTLRRMAEEIVETNEGTGNLVMVGIQRRGVQLAERMVRMIEEREGERPPLGSLDITLYRDDLQTVGPRPVVGPTNLPWNLDGKRLVIVDDVLFTGRTIRAALDELTDFGRASRIQLAVLVDRGGRELPIHADVVGRKVETKTDQRVDVLIQELDGRDAVVLASRAEPVPG
jgi:pyrimidine operon attenuation protein/uracil phosphoribosyltransferase